MAARIIASAEMTPEREHRERQLHHRPLRQEPPQSRTAAGINARTPGPALATCGQTSRDGSTGGEVGPARRSMTVSSNRALMMNRYFCPAEIERAMAAVPSLAAGPA
jgi:hypothetical protein